MGYIYADADSDLTDPGSWGISRFLRYNPGWEGAPPDAGRGMAAPGGGIEGNMTCTSDGNIVCLYRVDLQRQAAGARRTCVEKTGATPSGPLPAVC